jgi:hypothetical protein
VGSVISGSEAFGGAIAITLASTTAFIITGCNFTGNSVAVRGTDAYDAQGGAVWLKGASTIGPLISRTTFQGNTALATSGGSYGVVAASGGAVASSQARLSVVGSAFVANTVRSFRCPSASVLGGAVAVLSGALAMNTTIVRQNTAYANTTYSSYSSGGGLYVNGLFYGWRLRVVGNVASSAADSSGGGLALDAIGYSSSSSWLVTSVISGNIASCRGRYCLTASGGGVWLNRGIYSLASSGVTISRCTITNNLASVTSSTIDDGVNVRGGGIRSQLFFPLAILNTSISSNRIIGLSSSAQATLSCQGAGVDVLAPNGLLIRNSTIVGNLLTQSLFTPGALDRLAYGGGLAVSEPQNGMTVIDSLIARNIIISDMGHTRGAGVYIQEMPGDVSFVRTRVVGNTINALGIEMMTSKGGGVMVLSSDSTTLVFHMCAVSSNSIVVPLIDVDATTVQSGGGLYVEQYLAVELVSRSLFYRPSEQRGSPVLLY